MTKAIFLDRDGVINYDSKEYIKSPDEFHFIPRSLEAISRLTKASYKIGVATNQSGVARGLYTEETLAAIHQKLLQSVELAGGRIEAIVYCPHLPIQRCECRKPRPAMLVKLAKLMDVRLEGTVFVGDRSSDIEVALEVGMIPVLIRSPMTSQGRFPVFSKAAEYPSLLHYVKELLK